MIYIYEYPALRFSQYLMQTLNKTMVLYLHTKGAFNNHTGQLFVIDLWKNEFTYPRNMIYLQSILTNQTDISVPFRKGKCTWFNGMFISKRAFDSINEVPIMTDRGFYEGGIFASPNIKIKGIINDDITPEEIGKEMTQYMNKIRKKDKRNKIIIEINLILLIIIIKISIKMFSKTYLYLKRKNYLSSKRYI